MSELDWVDDLKVVELRKKLKELGENATGKKVVLVERLKTKLAEQAEEKPETAEPQGEEMEGVEENVVQEESGEKDGDAEKKEIKGGLNELLGDGKDDLEFDFEAEKPTRKKQKLTEASAKKEKAAVTEKASESSPSAKPSEKKSAEEDLVDFETAQVERKEGEAAAHPQGTEPARTSSVPEPVSLEAPTVAEEDRTCALRIDHFVRPFTEKAAKEMLSAFGTVVDMWMPPIKTHCYVIYEDTTQAHEAYLGTYNIVWPRSGKHLVSQYVSIDDAKKAIEEGRSKALFARASGSASYQKTRPAPFPPSARPAANAPSARPVAKPALALEDLFFKTQVKPPIYYLPLTDEQVAERKRLAQEKDSQEEKPADEGTKAD